MQTVDLLVTNGYLVTLDPERRLIPGGALAVSDGRIVAVGPTRELLMAYRSGRTIDATHRFVFPGFVNTHTHLFQGALKGLGRDKTLFDWLDSSVRWALREIGYEEIYAAAVVGLIEGIRTGVTTVLDYQYAHARERGLDEAVCQAFADVGIRGILGRAHTKVDRMPAGAECPYAETEQEFFDDVHCQVARFRDHQTISLALAPGIIWDLSEEGYRECRRLADSYGLPITMHVLETVDDNRYARETYGMNTMPFLEKTGILGPDFLAVHCVEMDEEDFRIFREHDLKVSHNPVSNMILASGVAPVPRMQEQGLCVALATDGSASNDTQDMLEVLKTTALLHKCAGRDPEVMGAAAVLEMAVRNGARAVGMGDEAGSLEPGRLADFWIMDPMSARCVPVADPVSALVYHAASPNVETVVVHGRVVLDRGEFPGLDEEAALARLQETARKLRERTGLANIQWGQTVSIDPFDR